MTSTINAISPWFGSKRTLAPRIIAELGPHSAYWEPFCGSLAVLLAKEPSSQETACDLHGDLVNLAWVLQSASLAPELYGLMARTLMSEPLYRHAQQVIRIPFAGHEPDLDRAYRYLVASWMGRNGMAGTIRDDSQIAVRWTKGGGSPAGRFRAVAESIPWWHDRLRNVLVLRRDAFEVLDKIDDSPRVAIYADPPYLMATRKGDRGGGRYRHEFAAEQHEQLAGLLRRFRHTRVVVSYYAHPSLADLYPGWVQLDCARKKSLSVQHRRGATAQDAPEVLLVNGPSLSESDGCSDFFTQGDANA